MKIRYGFVSNSSTSSFILAVKQVKDVCPTCGLNPANYLSIIQQLLPEGLKKNPVVPHQNVFTGLVSDVKATYESKLDDLKKSKKALEKSISNYKEILKDEKSLVAAGELIKLKMTLKHRKNYDDSSDYFVNDRNPQEVVESEIEIMEAKIRKADEEIGQISKMLSIIRSLKGKWEVVNIVVDDYSWGIKPLLDKLATEGVVKILDVQKT